MVLDLIPGNFTQAQLVTTLDHMLERLAHANTLSDLEDILDNTTLVGVLASWLFDCQQNNYSQRTQENYLEKTGKFLIFLGPKIIQPEQIKPEHIKLFLLKLRKTLKPSSEHDYYRAIHRYFQYMVDKNILKIHPMDGMKPPKVPRIVISPYTREEIKDMLLLCDKGFRYSYDFICVRNKAMILLYLNSGLRKNEMYEITLDRVNIRDRTIKVLGKGAKERIVGFGSRANTALREYFELRQKRVKDDCPYLWITEEGNRLGYDGIGAAIYDLRKRANINKPSSTHAMRHTFATQSLRNGARPDDVQRLMGHSGPEMTQRYQQTVNSEESVKQLQKFDPVDHWKL